MHDLVCILFAKQYGTCGLVCETGWNMWFRLRGKVGCVVYFVGQDGRVDFVCEVR